MPPERSFYSPLSVYPCQPSSLQESLEKVIEKRAWCGVLEGKVSWALFISLSGFSCYLLERLVDSWSQFWRVLNGEQPLLLAASLRSFMVITFHFFLFNLPVLLSNNGVLGG